MHIGIHESANAGPGDCHIKGGYINGTKTWTVKLANVSFYKNVAKGLPAGSGIFIVCDATNGGPLGIFQENRYLTDLRTGAAGAISVKHFAAKHHTKVSFIGTGVIAAAMARGTACVHKFDEGFAYGLDKVQTAGFAAEMSKELGYPIHVCDSAEEAVRKSDVIFTQTTGANQVLKLPWLRPHATIIASGCAFSCLLLMIELFRPNCVCFIVRTSQRRMSSLPTLWPNRSSSVIWCASALVWGSSALRWKVR